MLSTNATWSDDGAELLCYDNDRIPYRTTCALREQRMVRLENLRQMLDGTNPMGDFMSDELRYDWHLSERG